MHYDVWAAGDDFEPIAGLLTLCESSATCPLRAFEPDSSASKRFVDTRAPAHRDRPERT